MKKNLLFASGLFIASALSAQITITSNDMADAGESILVSLAIPVGIPNPSLTGTNYYWDYSSLTSNIQRYEKFDDPSTFPSPYNDPFVQFVTSYGKNNYTFTTIPNVRITAAYDFFRKSSSSIKQIGAGYVVNSMPIPFLYTAQDVIYKFPIHYLNIDSCNYEFGLPIPTLGYYGQTGHRVNMVDGWGTLVTPYGTFQCLRVKSTISAIDTIYSDNFGEGAANQKPLKYQYKWLGIGMKIPLLEIDANDIAGNFTITNIQYIDSIRNVPQVGINENINDNLNMIIYPNPSVDEIILQYTLTSNTPVKINITDVLGKTVATIPEENQYKGLYQKKISLADFHLTPGMYFINLEANNYNGGRKIIITK